MVFSLPFFIADKNLVKVWGVFVQEGVLQVQQQALVNFNQVLQQRTKTPGCEHNHSSHLYFWGVASRRWIYRNVDEDSIDFSSRDEFLQRIQEILKRREKRQGWKAMLCSHWNRQTPLPELMSTWEGHRFRKKESCIVLSITMFCWFKDTSVIGLWSMLKNTFSMDSRVSVYFSSVCLISERQQLRTSTSACVWKHKRLWEENLVQGLTAECCPVRSRGERNKNLQDQFQKKRLQLPSCSSPETSHEVCVCVCSCVWLIPAPAEVAAQSSSGLHISFHQCSCLPVRRQQRISRPHLQGHSRCRKGTRTHGQVFSKWVLYHDNGRRHYNSHCFPKIVQRNDGRWLRSRAASQLYK